NPHTDHAGGNVLTRQIGRFNRWFDRQALGYRRIITWALGHRKSTVALAVAAFVGSFLLFPFIGGGFMPVSDNSEFTVQFETPEGSSLAYTRGKGEQIVERLRALPGVDYTYTAIGAGATGTVTNGDV